MSFHSSFLVVALRIVLLYNWQQVKTPINHAARSERIFVHTKSSVDTFFVFGLLVRRSRVQHVNVNL